MASVQSPITLPGPVIGDEFTKDQAAFTNGTTTAGPSTSSRDFFSLFAFLISISSLREWLKLIVIGGLFEICRQFFSGLWFQIVGSFYITASFQEDDPCYDWMMVWLSKHPTWRKARDIEISTRSFGLASKALLIPGEEDDKNCDGGRKLAYLPSLSRSYSIWYRRRWMSVYRIKNTTGYYGRAEETLLISILTRDHNVLNSLLLEAKKAYKTSLERNISIYVSDPSYHEKWRFVSSRPKRALKTIVLDPGIKELLLHDAKDFLESKEWYVDRGIPFRRGYLLHGAPGTGKTSIIHSLAGELGLDVYVLSLSRSGLDDTVLSGLLSELPVKCIAIMEDIDAAFHQSVTRESPAPSSGPQSGSPESSSGSSRPSKVPLPSSKVTLSGLLNALDGVGAQEGRILYATTNKYDELDPAFCRPGRMDLHVEFKLASKFQATELFKRFYLPSSRCDEEEIDSGEKGCGDSGYGGSPVELSPLYIDDQLQPLSPSCTCSDSPTAHKHRLSVINLRQTSDLASQFGELIPGREFSMASLQGYLMGYKTRPWDAVKEAAAWVEKERRGSKGGD